MRTEGFTAVHRGFFPRVVSPVLLVLTLAAVSFVGYFGARNLANPWLHDLMAGVFGTLYFVSIAMGGLYVFTLTFLRGASFPERVIAAWVVPFLWMTKEVLVLTESHPIIQCLYWYLNPLNALLVSQLVAQMGLATLLARLVMKRRGAPIRVVTPIPAAVVVLGLAFGIVTNIGGNGEAIYVAFLEGFRILFGDGL